MTKGSRLKNIFATATALLTAAPLQAEANVLTAAAGAAASLGFTTPWILAGLAAVPPAVWIMRNVLHKPKQEPFPALALLRNLPSPVQKPVRLPLLQTILRTTALSAAIIGAAGPVLNPEPKAAADAGPLLLVVDNDWAAAPRWTARTDEMKTQISRAGREGRGVMILPTAAPADGTAVTVAGPMAADEALRTLEKIEPHPWPSDRAAALGALQVPGTADPSHVVWLSNGLDDAATDGLTQKLQDMGPLTVLEDSKLESPRLLTPPENPADANIGVTVHRPDGAEEGKLTVTASIENGRAVDQAEIVFKKGEKTANVVFSAMPPEIRNQITRLSIDGDESAGAALLLDERWRRRPVGLINTPTPESIQPLLNESDYVVQALGPHVNLRRGAIDELMKDKLAVIIVTDAAGIDKDTQKKLDSWIQGGGTLLRFAGPRLAAATESRTQDDLLPVKLRPGEHIRGGKLSGGKLGQIAPFDAQSPFYGIDVPQDIAISRDVLAEPGPGLNDRIWARLEDGTPLVTGAPRGEGWVVLVHTTANADWSNLVLSGAFVDMARAIVAHSQGTNNEAADKSALPPWKMLDGRGRLGEPAPAVQALTREVIAGGAVGPRNPPGFYGNDSARRAFNLANAVTELRSLPPLPESVKRQTYEAARKQTDLSGYLYAGVLGLLMADTLLTLGQGGARNRRRKTGEPAPAKAAPTAAP